MKNSSTAVPTKETRLVKRIKAVQVSVQVKNGIGHWPPVPENQMKRANVNQDYIQGWIEKKLHAYSIPVFSNSNTRRASTQLTVTIELSLKNVNRPTYYIYMELSNQYIKKSTRPAKKVILWSRGYWSPEKLSALIGGTDEFGPSDQSTIGDMTEDFIALYIASHINLMPKYTEEYPLLPSHRMKK